LAEGLLEKAGNGVMFNVSWLAIVASQSIVVALPVAAVHLLIHQLWLGQGRRELLFIAAVSLFGALLDQFLFAVGVFTLAGKSSLAPVWLSCLWPVLATTMNHAFSMLQRNLALAGVLGGIGGLGSYYAGTSMSVVDFADPVVGPTLITGLWIVLFPALATAARLTLSEDQGDARLA
jgi:hypothetical protein